MNYVNLHQHSIYSIRDAISKIKDMVSKAKELGYPAIALTDHGTLSGIIAFYKECLKQEIKPILGLEAYVAYGSRFERNETTKRRRYDHLTLLAMNNTGWQNLCRLVSYSHEKDAFYHKPRIDRDLLRRYNEGLICLSGCLAGHVAKAITHEMGISDTDEHIRLPNIECVNCSIGAPCEEHPKEDFRDVIKWYKNLFGDRYYLEIQNHDIPKETVVRETLLNVAQELDIKVVATGDSHYVQERDKETHDIMLAIRDGKTVNTEGFTGYPGGGYYMPDQEYLNSRFADCEFAVINTLEVAERCNTSFEFGNFKIPTYVRNIHHEDEYFMEQAINGLNKKFNNNPPPNYMERLQNEMTTIIQMTFPSYFLIVADYVNWAKKQGIAVGPGRGSAAGSLVSYCLGITDVDPIKYGLSFARFLNKGRAAFPVIDFPEYTFEQWKMDTSNL